MAYGLQVWDAAAALVFDSTVAVGGACLGIFNVPVGGATYTFPEITSAIGIALSAGYGGPLAYTSDSSLGYLRFVFTAGPTRAVLFAK